MLNRCACGAFIDPWGCSQRTSCPYQCRLVDCGRFRRPESGSRRLLWLLVNLGSIHGVYLSTWVSVSNEWATNGPDSEPTLSCRNSLLHQSDWKRHLRSCVVYYSAFDVACPWLTLARWKSQLPSVCWGEEHNLPIVEFIVGGLLGREIFRATSSVAPCSANNWARAVYIHAVGRSETIWSLDWETAVGTWDLASSCYHHGCLRKNSRIWKSVP